MQCRPAVDVLACIDRDMRNREAAFLLGVSENTVEFHLRNIYGKLGVYSRLDAVRMHRGLGAPGIDRISWEKII